MIGPGTQPRGTPESSKYFSIYENLLLLPFTFTVPSCSVSSLLQIWLPSSLQHKMQHTYKEQRHQAADHRGVNGLEKRDLKCSVCHNINIRQEKKSTKDG